MQFLLGDGTTTLLSHLSTMSLKSPMDLPPVPPTNQNQANRVPLAVGLTLGPLMPVVGVLGSICYLYLRRGKTPIRLDGLSVSPYTIPTMRQVGQQSCIPQNGKCPPRPNRPSSAHMAPGDPVMSSSGIGLGPPPSYETPIHHWRVGVAQ